MRMLGITMISAPCGALLGPVGDRWQVRIPLLLVIWAGLFILIWADHRDRMKLLDQFSSRLDFN